MGPFRFCPFPTLTPVSRELADQAASLLPYLLGKLQVRATWTLSHTVYTKPLW